MPSMSSRDDRHPLACAPSGDVTDLLQASQKTGLRQQALEILQGKTAYSSEQLKALSPEELGEILHELHVHQIELEIQNEELRQAQLELDAAKARYFDLYDLAPVSYLTVTNQGLIKQANLAAATLLGLPRRTLLNKRFSHFIDDLALYYSFYKQLFESDKPQALDLRMLSNDGTQFWAHLEAIVAQDEDGAPILRITLSNITKLIETEIALHESNRFKFAILNSISSQIAVLDSNGVIVSANKSWQNFVFENGTRLTSVGSSYLEACQNVPLGGSADEGQKMYKGIMMVLNGRLPHFSVEYVSHWSNRQRWFVMTATPLDMDKGGAVIIHTNITELKIAEEAQRVSEKRLDLAMEFGEIGVWDLDLIANTAWRSFEHDRILGYELQPSEWDVEIFMRHVVPEDREESQQSFDEALRTGKFRLECRINRYVGSRRMDAFFTMKMLSRYAYWE